MGNLLIVAVTALGRNIHTSFYFFLRNVALNDLCYLSVTVAKSILNFLLNVNSIFLPACTAQFFLVICLAGTEMALLTVMSHDRIMAICQLLRYDTIIHRLACASMLAASWFSSGLNATLYTTSAVSLSFCGPRAVQPCFCNGPQLLRLPCFSSHGAENLGLATTVSLPLFCFKLFVVSYVHIFWAVLRLPDAEGRAKAFSICLPHFTIVTLYITSGSSAYLKPISDSSSAHELMPSVFYSVVPPTLNPLSQSNRHVKVVMEKLLGQKPSQGTFL
ncbi:olfactory receptor 14A16-like [Tachyglossus aculeatus]|uniref:olfactory receptor 14A16-like n=1 Tax=Tachyglossus aculeatus TaxID=9261 RepID=UPI0018F727D5|nr:olfactory receptor 14A16-like [Tachyglossus aculeatus]